MKRREFVQATGAAMIAGMAVGSGRAAEAQQSAAKTPSANDKITVGLIGAGGRGMAVARDFLESKDVEIAAICDVDSDHLNRGIQEVSRARGNEIKGYSDFRKLLERKDLDAVIVGTPDHWHALATIHALEAGKDVYVEKPLSHTIVEGRKMVETAKRNNRITQMGIQIHNDASRNYARVAKTVRSGILGKIVKVRCWKTEKQGSLGRPPDGAPPATLDYDFWLGPAPKHAFNPNRSHFNFRFFWDYAGGKLTDFGCHIMDIAYSSMNLGPAKSVVASGGRYSIDDNTETPDTLEVLYDYGDFMLIWSQTSTNDFGFEGMGSIGCIFQGTEATLVTNYSSHKIFSEKGKHEELPKPQIDLPPFVSHAREFLNSVKSRKATSCNIEYGHALTTNVHLGNIAYRTGTKIVWDAKREKIIDNRRANALLERKYRKPWAL